MVNSKPQTAAIVTACVRRRLMQAGFYWCPQVDASPDGREAIDAALRLCSQYEDAFRHSFSEIQCCEVDVSHSRARIHFVTCMDEMLSDSRCSWGRVGGILTYGSMLALQAMTLNKPEMVADIAEWVADYMETGVVDKFITTEGGWSGLVRRFSDGEAETTVTQSPQSWLKAGMVAGAVIVAVSLLSR